ncbi:MAG: helicase HerA-like domain-containing protein [Actinomycetota bacterium]
MGDFRGEMATGYGFDGASVAVGRPLAPDGSPVTDVEVRLPVALLNRHGLITGATGTGKTRTLQLLAEQISAAGCPVFAADMKGDVAGIGAAGEGGGKVAERAAELGYAWRSGAAPVEVLSLTGDDGVPLRASVAGFGPTLLSKVLSLNETQESSLGLVFRFCEARGLPLVELSDLRAALAWLVGPGKGELESLGGLSKATVGVLQRKVTQLEADGGDVFFGEPSFDVNDLMRTAPDGRGVVNVLALADVAQRPALFSTFLMWLLAELFEELPEVGDLDVPKLVFFFDEAHLLFEDASKGFLQAVTQTVRLIRSKGVGVFFVTQLPTDLPDEVLGQLGHRVQHAVRAFTANDAKALRKVVDTYPVTEHYDLAETLQSLGVGEAVVTVLNPRGVPTPVAATRLFPPASRMAPLTAEERDAVIAASPLRPRYWERVDRESAEEMLAARVAGDRRRVEEARGRARPAPRAEAPRRPRSDDDLVGQVTDMLGSRVAQQIGREVVRGIFGLLKRRL